MSDQLDDLARQLGCPKVSRSMAVKVIAGAVLLSMRQSRQGWPLP